jgi:hypothetical protein
MRRISSWEKFGGGATPRGSTVLGKALQDLGLDCFAVYCTALVQHIPGRGPAGDSWRLTLERAGFAPQIFTAYRRHDAMMLAESQIAKQWSEYGVTRLIAANPDAFREMKPGAIPCTDCKVYPFWKPKKAIGPVDEPRYMQLLTPEVIAAAKMPAGMAMKAYFGNPADEEDPELRRKMEIIQEATWGKASGEE